MMAAVPATDLAASETSMNRLQRVWELLYRLPVDVVVLAFADGVGDVRYRLVAGQLHFTG